MTNNCVKTGAVVRIAPYQETYRGDAYAIGDVMVFRLNNSSSTLDQPDHHGVDYVVHDWDEWFDRHNGMTSTLLSRSVETRLVATVRGPKKELGNAE